MKAHGATVVTNAQGPRQPEAAGHRPMEATIVIDDSGDEDSQKQNDEGGTASRPAKTTKKKRITKNKSTSGGDAVEMSADSTQRTLVSSQKLRSSQRTRRAVKITSKSRASKSPNQRKPSVTSETVPPPTEDVIDETTSTGRLAEIETPAPTAERDKRLQSGFSRRRLNPVTPQLDKTREATETGKSSTSTEELRGLLTNISGRFEHGCRCRLPARNLPARS